MPSFLPNLDELKGLAISLNPLNIFTEQAAVGSHSTIPGLNHLGTPAPAATYSGVSNDKPAFGFASSPLHTDKAGSLDEGRRPHEVATAVLPNAQNEISSGVIGVGVVEDTKRAKKPPMEVSERHDLSLAALNLDHLDLLHCTTSLALREEPDELPDTAGRQSLSIHSGSPPCDTINLRNRCQRDSEHGVDLRQ
jgi:hypothetical protein